MFFHLEEERREEDQERMLTSTSIFQMTGAYRR